MRLDTVVSNEKATPKDWGFAKSKTKNTPMFWMEFELPELVASDGSGIVTIKKDWYLTENTLDYVLRDLALLGWTGKDVSELDKENGGKHSFFGHVVNISTKEETWTNDKGEQKTSIKVEYINDPSFAPMKPMETNELKMLLGGKIAGKIAAYRAKNPPPATAAKSKSKVFDPSEPE